VLDADGVLRPPDGVHERGRTLAARVRAQRLGDLEEGGSRDAAGLLDHLRRVAAEVPLQELEDAARVLERVVDVGRLSTREAAPVGTMRLFSRGRGLALAGGRLGLHAL